MTYQFVTSGTMHLGQCNKIALANTFSSHEMTILNNKFDMGDIDSAVDQV